jgi:hypothetical protein
MNALREWLEAVRPPASRSALAQALMGRRDVLATPDPVENTRMALPAEPARYGAALTNRSPDAVDGVRPMFGLPQQAPVVNPREEARTRMMADALMGASGTIRAFHGSPRAGLTELMMSERGPMGPGAYLSPDLNVANQYARGGQVYQAELPDNIFHGAGRTTMPRDANPYATARQQVASVIAAAPEQYRAQIAEIADKTMNGADGGYQFYGRLAQLFRSDAEAQALLQRAGYSGISGLIDGPEIAMFSRVPVTAMGGR